MNRYKTRAFTMIELMAVIAVILLLLGIVASVFRPDVKSTRVKLAVAEWRDALNEARQVALAKNKYVQVRLYNPWWEEQDEWPDMNVNVSHYTGMRLFIGDSPSYYPWDLHKLEPYSNTLWLPEEVILAYPRRGSKLIHALETDGSVPRYYTTYENGKKYRFIIFHFNPDGSTDLQYLPNFDLSDAYMSFCDHWELHANNHDVPDHFTTLSLNPLTGRAHILDPQ